MVVPIATTQNCDHVSKTLRAQTRLQADCNSSAGRGIPLKTESLMRESFVYAVLAMVCLGAIYLVTQGMDLINQPSDTMVAAGIGLIVLVVVLFPAAMRWIWHHKTTPHGRPIVVKAQPIRDDEETNTHGERTTTPGGQPKE
jgi:hypothetical protein